MQKFIIVSLLIISVFPFSSLLLAEDRNKISDAQLDRVISILMNPRARENALEEDNKAREADKKVGNLAGNEKNKEEIYDLSASVLRRLVEKSQGDLNRMMIELQSAKKDREGFIRKYFSDEDRRKLKELAEDIEGNNQGVP